MFVLATLSGCCGLVLLFSLAETSDAVEKTRTEAKKQESNPDQARVKELLSGIEEADRGERMRRWQQIHELRKKPYASMVLWKIAHRKEKASRYVRFVCAAMLAEIGKPTRIGPNSITNAPLGRYIDLQKGILTPRYLELDPSLKELKVTVPPNEKDDRYFQEILWYILKEYKLEFVTRPNMMFAIVKPNEGKDDISSTRPTMGDEKR